MNSTTNRPIHWSGCWERREGRVICRWIVCWSDFGSFTVGVIGGYSGGGAFQLEKFAVPMNGIPLIDADDDLSLALDAHGISITEECLDKALDFHNYEDWVEADTLYLKPDQLRVMREEDDLLLGQTAKLPKFLIPLFSKIGLTTRPTEALIEAD